ncbi:MAG: glycosyltransferase [Mycobacteriales bacterium]
MTPRVLFLTCHLPFPPVSGGRRREYELLRRVGARFAVDLVVVSKTPREDEANAAALSPHCASVRVLAADRQPISAAVAAPEQVRRHASAAALALIADATPDVVHVEGFYLMQHVPPDTTARVLLVEQNIEYRLWEQRARHADTDAQALLAEAARTRASELAAWQRADQCATVTLEDRAAMAAAGIRDVVVLPDGVEVPSLADGVEVPLLPEARGVELSSLPEARTSTDAAPRVVFVGNFRYEPNIDAARFLVRDILPLVDGHADLRVQLVGDAPPPAVAELAGPRVEVTGRVPAVEPLLDAATVVVCPLRVGGGVKVKMLEALARGKAIVTTSVGIQGLGAEARASTRVADSAPEFAAALTALLDDATARRELELAARQLAATLPTWDDAAAALTECWSELGSGVATHDGDAVTV